MRPLLLGLAVLSVAACAGTLTSTGVPPTASATAPATAAAATAIPARPPDQLRVWLPPSVSPVNSPSAEEVFAEQIAEFNRAHPNLTVEVRFKLPAGPGGLLNSLTTAYNAAPDALPDLIALTRDDLASAAEAGIVAPLDSYVPADTLNDFYSFAQAMGRPAGELVGLPFAVDARVLAFSTEVYPAAPTLWSELNTGPLIFPAAEDSALTILNEYLALGGTLADSAGRTMLDANVLAEVLAFFSLARTSGVLSPAILTYADPAATWQVFRERRAALAVTSANWYLAERGRFAAAAATTLPTRDGAALALADGWCWAVVGASVEHRTLAAELLLWLIEADRLGRWTLAAHVLPPRAAALAAWGESPLAPFASAVLPQAQLQPAAQVLSLIGPPLRQALDDVLSDRLTPQAAAAQAAQTVASR